MEQKVNEQDPLLLPENFINREISLIEFNWRVINEALDKSHPLFERLKFATILSSNLDEFFMIRVAGLKSQVLANVNELSYDGKSPKEQLKEIRKKIMPLYQLQESIWLKDIMPGLAKNLIIERKYNELNASDKQSIRDYFVQNVFPILTPLILGPANPFPRLTNRSLNIAFVLKDKTSSEEKIGILQIPSGIKRIVKLEKDEIHSNDKAYNYLLIENIIIACAEMLYPGYELQFANTFRVTRDADIEIAEDEAEDLLYEIKEQIILRRWGKAAVRLEVNAKMPEFLVETLKKSLSLTDDEVYKFNIPINLSDFLFFTDLDYSWLKDKPFFARAVPEFAKGDVFEAIKNNDILVRHPFDSFTNSVVKFINQAADDPNVIAIKITLYRTGKNSPIIAALKRAAHNGKYVTAFVELKARFDEENNIIWARELENVGVHVVYGVPGFKTHCKILMVVRRESEKLKTYLHLSTGNYNQTTSRIYTDVGFFTANDDFAHDAIFLFNLLTGYSQYTNWRYFSVAPSELRTDIIAKIQREAANSTPENPGLIFAKFNSLAHREVIQELYKASQKGVRIQFICRGVCCLRPGIKGVSENIEVRSIVGRFLEHDRIFYFKNGGNDEMFLSSADLMTRNLHRRIEVMFPIKNAKLKENLYSILETYWKDNSKAWRLMPDGSYRKIETKPGEHKFSAQNEYLRRLKDLN